MYTPKNARRHPNLGHSNSISWFMSTAGQFFFLVFAFKYVILQLLCMCKDHAAMTGHASATAHVQDTVLFSKVSQMTECPIGGLALKYRVETQQLVFNCYFHLACFVTVTTVDVTVLMNLLLCNHFKKSYSL